MQYSLLCRTLRHGCRCYCCINSFCKRSHHATKRLIILLYKFISFSPLKNKKKSIVYFASQLDVDAARRKLLLSVFPSKYYIMQANEQTNERLNEQTRAHIYSDITLNNRQFFFASMLLSYIYRSQSAGALFFSRSFAK